MDDFDEEEFGDVEQDDQQGGKQEAQPTDNLLFVIDARANMNAMGPGGVPQLSTAFKTVIDMVRGKMQQADKSKVGVMLLGTAQKGSTKYDRHDHINYLMELDEPSVGSIKLLQGLADDMDHFKKTYGQVSQLPVDKALSICKEILNLEIKNANDDKRIFFISNDDNPECKRKAVELIVSDAKTEGVEILVLPVQRPGSRAFEVGAFWTSVAVKPRRRDLDLDPESDGGGAGGGSSSSSSSARGSESNVLEVSADGSLPKNIEIVSRRMTKKRTYARLPLTLGPGIHLGINLYNNYYPAKKPTAKNIFGENLAAGKSTTVKTESRYIDSSTGEALQEQELMQYYEVAGQKVHFTPSEAKSLRTVPGKGRGIEIVGFQGAERLRQYDNLRPPYLCYPSERDIEGSTTAFRALWQRMIDRRLVAIALLTTREGYAPRVVALMPEQERVNGDMKQLSAPGIYAITLPYADDIRHVTAFAAPAATVAAGSAAAEAAAGDMVQRLFDGQVEALQQQVVPPIDGGADDSSGAVAGAVTTTHYPRQMIPNPALKQFYSGLEAIALNLKDYDKEDRLKPFPDAASQEANMGDAVTRFVAETGLGGSGGGAGAGAGAARGRGRGRGGATAAAAAGTASGRGRGKKAAAAGAEDDGAAAAAAPAVPAKKPAAKRGRKKKDDDDDDDAYVEEPEPAAAAAEEEEEPTAPSGSTAKKPAAKRARKK